MAIQFPDLNPGGPSATSNDKVIHQKSVRLLAADFAVGGVSSVKAVLPADSTILEMTYWKKTQFSGGGVTALSLSIGIPGAPTQFVGPLDALTPTANAAALIPLISNIYQPYGLPLGPDIALQFLGTATTGAPTAGEMYVTIKYVR